MIGRARPNTEAAASHDQVEGGSLVTLFDSPLPSSSSSFKPNLYLRVRWFDLGIYKLLLLLLFGGKLLQLGIGARVRCRLFSVIKERWPSWASFLASGGTGAKPKPNYSSFFPCFNF